MAGVIERAPAAQVLTAELVDHVLPGKPQIAGDEVAPVGSDEVLPRARPVRVTPL